MPGGVTVSTIACPPAATLTRSRLCGDTAAIPKCGGWGVLAILAVLAEVLPVDRGISGSDTRLIILIQCTLCRAARKRHEADPSQLPPRRPKPTFTRLSLRAEYDLAQTFRGWVACLHRVRRLAMRATVLMVTAAERRPS